MRIAYLILAYKNPEQLLRLITTLNSETTSFFVHIDKKTDDNIYLQLLEVLKHHPNVYFLERHDVHWGDFSVTETIFKSLEEVLDRSVPFDYVKLLSGQDYPLKSNEQIEQFFLENKGKSFIEFFALPCPNWEKNGGLNRLQYWHFRLFNRSFCFPLGPNFDSRLFVWLFRSLFFPFYFIKRKFPEGFTPYGGSTQWCLSRECAEYVTHFVKQKPQFVKFFKYALCADEIFFQTIILNSPFRELVINNDLTYVYWLKNSAHPEILGKDNFDQLFESGCVFARKFDITKDTDILDMIDQRISQQGSVL